MQKHSRSTEFASYVRNYTANAVRLTIPFGTLESAPKMSADEHSQLIARNRKRYTVEQKLAQTAASPAGSSVIDIGKSHPSETAPEKSARTNSDDTSTKPSSNW